MRCPYCGEKNDSTASFCGGCGKRLCAGGNRNTQGSAPVHREQPKKNSRITIAVLITVLVLFGIVCSVTWIALQIGQEAANAEQTVATGYLGEYTDFTVKELMDACYGASGEGQWSRGKNASGQTVVQVKYDGADVEQVCIQFEMLNDNCFKVAELNVSGEPITDQLEKLAVLNDAYYKAYTGKHGLSEKMLNHFVECLDQTSASFAEYGSAKKYRENRATLCQLDGQQPLDISVAQLLHASGKENLDFYYSPPEPTVENSSVQATSPTVPPKNTKPANSATKPTTPAPSPTISITQQTVPSELKEGSRFDIRGIVSTDVGTLTRIRGTIRNTDGTVVMDSTYSVDSRTCNLKDSINNDLTFGRLPAGNYRYVLEASAKNNSLETNSVLIDQQFRVVRDAPVQAESVPTQPVQSETYIWSNWMTQEELRSFNRTAVETETKTQFRSRTKKLSEWTTDSYRDGWTLFDTQYSSSGWSGWSEWQYEYIAADQNRDVDTRQVQVSEGSTQYRYGRWYRDTPDNNSYCYARFYQGGTEPTVDYTPWSTERYYLVSSGWTCGNLSLDGREHSHIGSTTGSDGNPYWNLYSRNGSDAKESRYFWEESRYVEPEYRTQYRYRVSQAETLYRYYQWSTWSDWSDVRAYSSDSCEVQTRQLYRVKYVE